MSEILIRRAEPSDAEAVQRVFASPGVIRGTLGVPYPSLALQRSRLEPHDDVLLYVACVENEVVGELGLHLNTSRARRRHVGGIGMGVRDDWQGKGVGTALMQAAVDVADKWLNLTRLELEVFVDNEPAIRLYKKFGFVIEGTCQQFAFRDGAYADCYMMARIRG